MNSTVLKEIMAFLLGRKYYANIIATRGTTKQEICSYIFATKEAAERHRDEIETTLSFRYIETVSFRSRKSVWKRQLKVKQFGYHSYTIFGL